MFRSSYFSLTIQSSRHVAWLSVPVGAICLFLILRVLEVTLAEYLMVLHPPSEHQGRMFYIDLVRLAATEILWLSFFALSYWALVSFFSHPEAAFDSRPVKAGYFAVLACLLFYFIVEITAFSTLEGFPNSSNEFAYLFQAEMFSTGKWWYPSHDLPDFFYFNNIVQQEGVFVSKYSPGWPMVLSAAFMTGFPPQHVNPVLALLTLIVFYTFARKMYGQEVAVWSLVTLAFTGYFIFTSASFFSHVLSALVALLFVGNIHLYEAKQNVLYGLIAGFALGFLVIIRYYTALLIFLPFFVYFVYKYRSSSWKLCALLFLGCLPSAGLFLWYNYTITGDAFLPVEIWAYPQQQIGFVKGHTTLKGLEHLARRVLMFCYWASPGLLILYGVLLWRKAKDASARFANPEDYLFLSLMAGYFFYHEIGGNQYGPRFLFEGFPFLVLFVVSRVVRAREKWLTALLFAGLVFAIFRLPFISHREGMIVDQRQDVYDLVSQDKISNAVVLVASSTSSLRPMPPDDLTRNDRRFQNSVIYALDLGSDTNKLLMDYYSDRSFYRYIRDPDDPRGELIKIK